VVSSSNQQSVFGLLATLAPGMGKPADARALQRASSLGNLPLLAWARLSFSATARAQIPTGAAPPRRSPVQASGPHPASTVALAFVCRSIDTRAQVVLRQ
jgi:hypothetical protein